MNFLAHIYLSFDHPDVIFGNFIGDFVKGKEINNYPDVIKKGIKLHRAIDDYTDRHEVVLASKKRLRPRYHHYAPVIVDVYYDHFLSLHWEDYHPTALDIYSRRFYQSLEKYNNLIPAGMGKLIYFMSRDNWLYQYQMFEGLNQAFTGISRRTKFDSGMENALTDLKADYEAYEKEFRRFFPDLVKFAKSYLNINDD